MGTENCFSTPKIQQCYDRLLTDRQPWGGQGDSREWWGLWIWGKHKLWVDSQLPALLIFLEKLQIQILIFKVFFYVDSESI